jgi:hypothetical protein
MHLINSFLSHIQYWAATCFGTLLPSSGSSCVPTPYTIHHTCIIHYSPYTIHASYTVHTPYTIHKPYTIRTPYAIHHTFTINHTYTIYHTYTIQKYNIIKYSYINHRPKSACNSAGTEEFPEDGTQMPKHVGATE